MEANLNPRTRWGTAIIAFPLQRWDRMTFLSHLKISLTTRYRFHHLHCGAQRTKQKKLAETASLRMFNLLLVSLVIRWQPSISRFAYQSLGYLPLSQPYVVQVFYSSHQSSAIHHIRLATPRGHGQLAFWYAYQKVSRLTATSIHRTTHIDRSTIQRWFPNNSFFESISEIFPSFLIQAEGKFEPTAQDVETSIDFSIYY